VDVTWRGECKDGRIDVGGGKVYVNRQRDGTHFNFSVLPEDVVVLRVKL
jgi:hypothetical protein